MADLEQMTWEEKVKRGRELLDIIREALREGNEAEADRAFEEIDRILTKLSEEWDDEFEKSRYAKEEMRPSAVREAIKAIRLAKAGPTRDELGRAMLMLTELWAAYDLVRMNLADEAAQAWQQEVGSKVRFVLDESAEDVVDMEAIRKEVQEIKNTALRWQELVDQGQVNIRSGYEQAVRRHLSDLVERCDDFLSITEGWTTVVVRERKEPEKVVQENLEKIGRILEFMPIGEHSRALRDVKAAFEGLRAAVEAKDKGEIAAKVEEFKEAWWSFVEEMKQYNWFGSIRTMEAAVKIDGELVPELLRALSDLGLWSIHG